MWGVQTVLLHAQRGRNAVRRDHHLAVGETFTLLHLPLPLVGVSIETTSERQQSDRLVDGYHHPEDERVGFEAAAEVDVVLPRRHVSEIGGRSDSSRTKRWQGGGGGKAAAARRRQGGGKAAASMWAGSDAVITACRLPGRNGHRTSCSPPALRP